MILEGFIDSNFLRKLIDTKSIKPASTHNHVINELHIEIKVIKYLLLKNDLIWTLIEEWYEITKFQSKTNLYKKQFI